MLKLFEVLASCLQDDQNELETLINSRAEPDVVKARLQELLLLLDGLNVHGKEVERELRGTGDKGWIEVLGKRRELSRQVKTLEKHVREYLNVNEVSKTVTSNVNRTRVFPYAGETQSVTCALNNDRNVLRQKKISASDNVINCRERQVPNVYSVGAASARPPEFRSDRQPNHLATVVASPKAFVRERPNTVARNEFTKTLRSSGDIRSNCNKVAGIKPVVTQRYCGELVSKNRCGDLRQKPDYPFVAPSSAVDKQPRVCNQRQPEREMLQRSAPYRYHHDIAVPSAVLHSPSCIDNSDRFASQSNMVDWEVT